MRPIHDSVASFEDRLKSLLGKELVVATWTRSIAR